MPVARCFALFNSGEAACLDFKEGANRGRLWHGVSRFSIPGKQRPGDFKEGVNRGRLWHGDSRFSIPGKQRAGDFKGGACGPRRNHAQSIDFSPSATGG